jgi:microcystin degradation protein MlrC
MKILIAECKQEVSSFNPVASHYRDFAISRGGELFDFHRTARNEVGGALDVFDARPDVQLVPAYGARAITSGGTLAADDWDRIAREFLDAVRHAGPVDGIYFSLHGAMSAENEDDPEGFLLRETRKRVGEQVPIVVSLDLHGILTERMLTHSDAIVVYHTYPHVDFFETGQRAARLLLRILDDGARPVMAMVVVPALVRGDEMITSTGSIRHVIRAAQEAEAGALGLSAGMFWGNPFTDVPELRSNSLVVADGDVEVAAEQALNIANLFWHYHEKMRVPLTSIPDAVRAAHETVEGTVVLVDAADATSSGASGDSNAILAALIESGYTGRALVPIVDPPAVRAAFAAGVGEMIAVTLGGARDPARFKPLPVHARVKMLSDGLFRSEHARDLWDAGDTAVLEIGATVVIATSRAVSLFDRALFYAHGQDPKAFDLVVVKSPHCEHHMFKAWAARYIDVDAPGATSANVKSLGHTKCARPMFPLDEDVTFEPQVRIFQRGKDAE